MPLGRLEAKPEATEAYPSARLSVSRWSSSSCSGGGACAAGHAPGGLQLAHAGKEAASGRDGWPAPPGAAGAGRAPPPPPPPPPPRCSRPPTRARPTAPPCPRPANKMKHGAGARTRARSAPATPAGMGCSAAPPPRRHPGSPARPPPAPPRPPQTRCRRWAAQTRPRGACPSRLRGARQRPSAAEGRRVATRAAGLACCSPPRPAPLLAAPAW